MRSSARRRSRPSLKPFQRSVRFALARSWRSSTSLPRGGYEVWVPISVSGCCRPSRAPTISRSHSDRPGRLLVVSGPSGVGKGTVVAALARARDDVAVAVSATTRAPRAGEVDGVHYHFMSDDQFDELVAAGEFVEWAEYNGHRYGTLWSIVSEASSRGCTTLVLEIEVRGALQVRRRFPDAVLVFLEPPSMHELERRV